MRRFDSQLRVVEAAYGDPAASASPDEPDEPVETDDGSEPEDDEAFDPADYKVEDVIAYAEKHPDEVEAILNAEVEGKGRTTIIEALTSG